MTAVSQSAAAICLYALCFTGLTAFGKALESRSHWGTDVTPAECKSQGGSKLLEAILTGQADSYAFSGPPLSCEADGCRHAYWGPRCRYSDPNSPACPQETREGLIEMLKDYARNGAGWARDALSLQPCELWQEIKGRTVWMAGDSVSQETANSLICFLLEYFETAREAGPISEDERIMHRLTTNANNMKLTTWCALFKEDTRVCMLRANFGPRMATVLLPALVDLAAPHDIVVMNFGLWSNHLQELAMHTEIFESAFRFYQGRMPNRTFWRETSAQHYTTLSGMFDKDKPIVEQRCSAPYPGVNLTIGVEGDIIPTSKWPQQYSPEEWEAQVMMSGGYRNRATQPAVDRLGLHTIRTWNTSLALWDFHHHTHMPKEPQACAKVDCDCTHSCHPSWSQIWLPKFHRAFSSSELFMEGGQQPWSTEES